MPSDAYVADGSLFVKNSAIFNNVANFDNAGTIETDPTNSTSGPSLSGFVGTDAAGAVESSAVDSWFSSVTYKGAVPAGDDWTTGWTLGL